MSTGTNLASRVQALERTVAALSSQRSIETRTPSYLTITPTGQVGASFSGKISASELDLIGGPGASPIKWLTSGGGLLAQLTVDASGDLILSPAGQLEAQGVVLPAGTFGSPPTNAQEVQWNAPNNLGGAIIGSVWTFGDQPGNNRGIQARAIKTTAGDNITNSLCLVDQVGTVNFGLQAQMDNLGTVSATGAGFLIGDTNGRSQFLRLASGPAVQRVQSGTNSFSLGAGWATYGASFPTAFAGSPTFVFSVQETGGGATITSSEISGINASGYGVDINSTIAQTGIVHWIAIGP